MVGYFPEGTSYGPQTSEATATTFVLQFGGSSGQGYLSRKEVKQSMDALRPTSTLDGGVYRRNEGEPGKRNLDGYQAIWEQANGRPLQFPKPRYDKPVMMDQAGYEWVPLDGSARRVREAARRIHRAALGGRPVPIQRRRDADGIGTRHLSRLSRRRPCRRAAASSADHGVPGARRAGVVHSRAGDRAVALRPAGSARALEARSAGGVPSS